LYYFVENKINIKFKTIFFMETKEKKPINYYMRLLHRYIGFFIVGFAVIYALSGITLIYRDSDFLKKEKINKVNLPVETKPTDLGQALKMRELKILKTEGELIYFQGGTFNTITGEAIYTVKELIFPFNKLTNLHKTPSKNPFHWFTLAFGTVLLFMAISSFWMLNKKSKVFRTGLYTILAGFVFALILLFLIK
jgi:hypothetical protein